jgi:hypothetical protein
MEITTVIGEAECSPGEMVVFGNLASDRVGRDGAITPKVLRRIN